MKTLATILFTLMGATRSMSNLALAASARDLIALANELPQVFSFEAV
jgi:hypothetical protein